ncbi:hypothetical protein COO60DRAFT_1488333 [Scenedesmus sp. NREL 46B-D3]|nr:hypothetical protein COO60DRAFT_1488333 [Scenedesmus sp. NREL 46B-D3]
MPTGQRSAVLQVWCKLQVSCTRSTAAGARASRSKTAPKAGGECAVAFCFFLPPATTSPQGSGLAQLQQRVWSAALLAPCPRLSAAVEAELSGLRSRACMTYACQGHYHLLLRDPCIHTHSQLCIVLLLLKSQAFQHVGHPHSGVADKGRYAIQ